MEASHQHVRPTLRRISSRHGAQGTRLVAGSPVTGWRYPHATVPAAPRETPGCILRVVARRVKAPATGREVDGEVVSLSCLLRERVAVKSTTNGKLDARGRDSHAYLTCAGRRVHGRRGARRVALWIDVGTEAQFPNVAIMAGR